MFFFILSTSEILFRFPRRFTYSCRRKLPSDLGSTSALKRNCGCCGIGNLSVSTAHARTLLFTSRPEKLNMSRAAALLWSLIWTKAEVFH